MIITKRNLMHWKYLKRQFIDKIGFLGNFVGDSDMNRTWKVFDYLIIQRIKILYLCTFLRVPGEELQWVAELIRPNP